jgi:hypothetical protein
MMEIFTRQTLDSLSSRFSRILLASLDSEPGRVVVVTPWIGNVRLPIEGHQATNFGSHLSEATLEEVLARVARHHELHMVVKAPQELVDLHDVERLMVKIERRERLLEEEELAGYAIRDELISDLNDDIAYLADQALRHFGTIELVLRLRERGAKVHFLEALHAKLLWTPLHAFFGSANFTASGFSRNEELSVEVSSRRSHDLLGQAAEGFILRATPADKYDLGKSEAARTQTTTLSYWAKHIPATTYPHLSSALKQLEQLVRYSQ